MGLCLARVAVCIHRLSLARTIIDQRSVEKTNLRMNYLPTYLIILYTERRTNFSNLHKTLLVINIFVFALEIQFGNHSILSE